MKLDLPYKLIKEYIDIPFSYQILSEKLTTFGIEVEEIRNDDEIGHYKYDNFSIWFIDEYEKCEEYYRYKIFEVAGNKIEELVINKKIYIYIIDKKNVLKFRLKSYVPIRENAFPILSMNKVFNVSLKDGIESEKEYSIDRCFYNTMDKIFIFYTGESLEKLYYNYKKQSPSFSIKKCIKEDINKFCQVEKEYNNNIIYNINIMQNRPDLFSWFAIINKIKSIKSLDNNKKSQKETDKKRIVYKNKYFDICSISNKIDKSIKQKIHIMDKNYVSNYTYRVIKNIKGIPQKYDIPKWLSLYFKCCYGFISTNNIITDIVQFVSIEYGCSLDIFDLDKIKQNNISICQVTKKDISRYNENKNNNGLDRVYENDLIIVGSENNNENNVMLSFAGIPIKKNIYFNNRNNAKYQNYKVTHTTKNIIIGIGNFNCDIVNSMLNKRNMSASIFSEKNNNDMHNILNRITKLLANVVEYDKVSKIFSSNYKNNNKRKEILCDLNKVNDIIGFEPNILLYDEIINIFRRNINNIIISKIHSMKILKNIYNKDFFKLLIYSVPKAHFFQERIFTPWCEDLINVHKNIMKKITIQSLNEIIFNKSEEVIIEKDIDKKILKLYEDFKNISCNPEYKKRFPEPLKKKKNVIIENIELWRKKISAPQIEEKINKICNKIEKEEKEQIDREVEKLNSKQIEKDINNKIKQIFKENFIKLFLFCRNDYIEEENESEINLKNLTKFCTDFSQWKDNESFQWNNIIKYIIDKVRNKIEDNIDKRKLKNKISFSIEDEFNKQFTKVKEEIINIIRTTLKKVDFQCSKTKNIISYQYSRCDINNENDIAEEFLQAYGINNIPDKDINSMLCHSISDDEYSKIKLFREEMISLGFTECINNLFINKNKFNFRYKNNQLLENFVILDEELQYQNALSPNLLFNMLNTIKENIYYDNHVFRLFEIGKIFKNDNEQYSCCIALSGEVIDPYGNIESVENKRINNITKRKIDLFDLISVLDKWFNNRNLSNLSRISKRTVIVKNNKFKSIFKNEFVKIDVETTKKGINDVKSFAKCGELSDEFMSDFIKKKKYPIYVAIIKLETIFNIFDKKIYYFGKPINYPSITKYFPIKIKINKNGYKDLYNEIYDNIFKKNRKLQSFSYSFSNVYSGEIEVMCTFIYNDSYKTLTHNEVKEAHDEIISALEDYKTNK